MLLLDREDIPDVPDVPELFVEHDASELFDRFDANEIPARWSMISKTISSSQTCKYSEISTHRTHSMSRSSLNKG